MDSELKKSLLHIFCVHPEGVRIGSSGLDFLDGLYFIFVDGEPISKRYTDKDMAEKDARIIRNALSCREKNVT